MTMTPAADLPGSPPRPPALWIRGLGPLLILLSVAFLLYYTWGRWLDPIIDFGRELYIPWQLAQGKRLYVDVVSFYGPLSSYLNAAWFKLTGPGLTHLALLNALLLTCLAELLYLIAARLAGRFAAGAASLAVVVLCGFGRLIPYGGFNFITPYAHEMTHGLLLAVLSLYLLIRLADTMRPALVAAMGLTVGLTFLTKPEPFIAALGATLFGLFGLLWPGGWRNARRWLCLYLLALLTPLLIAWLLLATQMSFRLAAQGVLGSWPFMFKPQVTSQYFFRQSMGLDEPAFNLLEGLKMLLWYAAFLIPLAAAALLARCRPRMGLLAILAMTAVWVVLLWWRRDAILWLGTFRPAPVCLLALALWQGGRLCRCPPAEKKIFLLRLSLVLFALLLMLKMLLSARLFAYGFGLGIGGVVVLVMALLAWLPEVLTPPNPVRRVLQGSALAVLVVLVGCHWRFTEQTMQVQTVPLGRGADAFKADPRGEILQLTLNWIAQEIPPGKTLTVLPEGVMINYLTRHPSASPFLTFLPTDLAMFSEEELLASLMLAPPDYIVVVDRRTPSMGPSRFGIDYGQWISVWVHQHYLPAAVVGGIPFSTDAFGVLILRRHEVAVPPAQGGATPPEGASPSSHPVRPPAASAAPSVPRRSGTAR